MICRPIGPIFFFVCLFVFLLLFFVVLIFLLSFPWTNKINLVSPNVLSLELILRAVLFLKKLNHRILSSHICLLQNILIHLFTSKGSWFITKKLINKWMNKNLFCEKMKKGFGTANPFFSGLGMYFYWLWYLMWSDCLLLHLKHVSLGFNV